MTEYRPRKMGEWYVGLRLCGSERWRVCRGAASNSGILLRRLVLKVGTLALGWALLSVASAAATEHPLCNRDMTAEQAYEALSSSTGDRDVQVCEDLVKSDIKTCLKMFFPKDCTGMAKKWVNNWGNLKLEYPEMAKSDVAEDALKGLHPPSGQWQVPFAKSPTDYWGKYYSPYWFSERHYRR